MFLLLKMCFRKNTSKTFIYSIQIELIIACTIYTIGFILPTKKNDDNVHTQNVLCTIQTILLSFSNNTAILLTVAIPTITYKLLVNPSFFEKNPTIVHLVISGICWGFGLVITIIFMSISSTTYSEYTCGYMDQTIVIISMVINYGVWFIIVFVLYKLKRNIQFLIKDNQIDSPETYLLIFNDFLFLVIFAFVTLSIALINGFIFIKLNEYLYCSFLIINSILECLLYIINSYIFCFQKEMLPCSCCTQQKDREKRTATENLSLMIMTSDNKEVSITL